VVIVDHGESPEYNELTHESFSVTSPHRDGPIPCGVKLVDIGTITQDANCFGCSEPSMDPQLNAWLSGHDGPVVYVPASDSTPAHYVVPGGPGLGEADIFEHVGLSAWHKWELMGGPSPNYDEKLPKTGAVIARLRDAYGPNLPVRIGYGIDPRLNGSPAGHPQGRRRVTVSTTIVVAPITESVSPTACRRT
jgi:hypothetical protein